MSNNFIASCNLLMSFVMIPHQFLINRLFLTDAGDYLREILPAFFIHQKIHPRRLRRILNRLPSESGKNHGASGLGLSDHQARINAWVASATAAQIRQLPAALTRSGADGAGHRLLSKLQRIEWSLSELNDSRNEVDNIVQ